MAWFTGVPTPPKYDNGIGAVYAQDLAAVCQRRALRNALGGWTAIAIGVIFLAAATVVRSDSASNSDWLILDYLRNYPGVFSGVLGAIFVALGRHFIDDAKAATHAARLATRAIEIASQGPDPIGVTGDRRAYTECVKAKCVWLDRRMKQERLEALIAEYMPQDAGNSQDSGETGQPDSGSNEDSQPTNT